MTPDGLAMKLTGLEYPVKIPDDLVALAKANGLVIVFGASDDLMEFRGAIDDEVGAYEGAVVSIDRVGLVPEFDQIDKDAGSATELLRDFFKREGGGKTIRALWCPDDIYSWAYETTIPHATFEVVEDGEPYCRGIVFNLAALGE